MTRWLGSDAIDSSRNESEQVFSPISRAIIATLARKPLDGMWKQCPQAAVAPSASSAVVWTSDPIVSQLIHVFSLSSRFAQQVPSMHISEAFFKIKLN